MGVNFQYGWQRHEDFPLNEKAVTKLLQGAGGAVGNYANASNESVLVVAGVHAGGRPGDPHADPRLHLTVAVPRHGTCHVVVTGRAGDPRITEIDWGPN